MYLLPAVLFHPHQEEAPLWINPAEPTWERTVCSLASMWLRARRSPQEFPVCERSWITDLSPSRRGIKPSWWSVDTDLLVRFQHFLHDVHAWFCSGLRGWGYHHFSKDAPQTPDVNSCGVVFAAQEDLWCSVPKCYHLNIKEKNFFQQETKKM